MKWPFLCHLSVHLCIFFCFQMCHRSHDMPSSSSFCSASATLSFSGYSMSQFSFRSMDSPTDIQSPDFTLLIQLPERSVDGGAAPLAEVSPGVYGDSGANVTASEESLGVYRDFKIHLHAVKARDSSGEFTLLFSCLLYLCRISRV